MLKRRNNEQETILSSIKEQCNKRKYGMIHWHVSNKELYKEFNNATEAEEWGKEHYLTWAEQYISTMDMAEHLIKEEFFTKTVELYCGNSYMGINRFLRSGYDMDSGFYREMADILSIVLCSAPRVPCNLIVYRLVNDAFIQRLIENNRQNAPAPIQEKGFMSTSLLKNFTDGTELYAKEKNLLKIYVEQGAVGIYVNTITKRHEEEMLLCPNMYLALVNYPYKDIDTNKMIFECKLIGFY